VAGMSGCALPVVTDASEASGGRITLRLQDGAAKFDGFRIRAGDGEVIIESAVPGGCIYGAYDLLERLGCRFYGFEPLGIIVPKRTSISIPGELDVLCEPSYENRLPFPGRGSPEDFARCGFNFLTYVPDWPTQTSLVEKLNLKRWRWGHVWPGLTKLQFFEDGREPQPMDNEERADWLPEDEEGVRRPNGETLCFSNPDALEWFAENAVNFVLSECRNADYVSVWPADAGRALCQCDECRRRGWNYTDWYLHVQNTIRRKLNERGWENTFGWIATEGSQDAPENVDLLENGRQMDFLYAPRSRGASVHGPFTDDHPINVRYRENLQGWCEYRHARTTRAPALCLSTTTIISCLPRNISWPLDALSSFRSTRTCRLRCAFTLSRGLTGSLTASRQGKAGKPSFPIH